MYKFIVLLLVIFGLSYADDFGKSKKILLKQIYPDHQKTFYCGNSYKLDIVDGKEKTVIIKDINKYSPRKPNRFESKFVNGNILCLLKILGNIYLVGKREEEKLVKMINHLMKWNQICTT